MSKLIEELTKACELMDMINSIAVKGIITHEEKEALISVVKDETAKILRAGFEKTEKKSKKSPQ